MRVLRGRRVLVLLAAVLTVALAGCGGSAGDVPRAGAEALAVDAYGCPDLEGRFSVLPPNEQGQTPRRSVREGLSEHLSGVPFDRVRGVQVSRLPAGGYEFRFALPEEDVLASLRWMRQSERQRYSEWYQALKPERRAAYVAEYGETRYAELLRSLGPQTEAVAVVRSGSAGVACRDGWLELPREYADPIRLTRGEDGSIIGEAGQLQTYDIPIWCGDGCKDLPIPTGTYTATLRWPRNDALKPWDALAAFPAVERPLDEVEAAERAIKRAQQREDAARYLADGTIRERLQALAPEDTRIDAVDVAGGRVFVRYVAPTEHAEALLRRIEHAGKEVARGGPQDLKIIVNTTRQFERTVEFVLTDSPLVLRYPPSPTASAEVAGGADTAAAERTGADAGKAASDATPTLAPLSAASGGAVADASPGTPPAGYAEAEVIVDRTQDLFPAGCRVQSVRYRGEKLIISGRADALRCISEGLRALDARQSQPELLSVTQGERGARDFRILISPSALTRK